MISAFIFDLDGTLVQTEILKAHSYAKAVTELCSGRIAGKRSRISEREVIDAYKMLAGRSREEVAKSLIKKFNLEKESASLMKELKVDQPWEAFVRVRLRYYFEFLDTPRILKTVVCPYSAALLRKVRFKNYKTALATTSHIDEASKVLEILGLKDLFDFIATRDLIEHSKPDPEIYNLVLSKLNLKGSDCIAIEDSLTGIKAALAAQINCIAAINDYTRDEVNESNLLEKKWIVNDLKKLDSVAEELLKLNS